MFKVSFLFVAALFSANTALAAGQKYNIYLCSPKAGGSQSNAPKEIGGVRLYVPVYEYPYGRNTHAKLEIVKSYEVKEGKLGAGTYDATYGDHGTEASWLYADVRSDFGFSDTTTLTVDIPAAYPHEAGYTAFAVTRYPSGGESELVTFYETTCKLEHEELN